LFEEDSWVEEVAAEVRGRMPRPQLDSPTALAGHTVESSGAVLPLPQGQILPGKAELNPLIAAYMITYGFSRVCRYMPDKWAEVVEGRNSNERWLVEKCLEASTALFPVALHSVFVDKPVLLETI